MTALSAWWREWHRPKLSTVVYVVLFLSMVALSLATSLAFSFLTAQRSRTADEAIQEYAALGARLFGDRSFGLFEGARLRILSVAYAARLGPGQPLPDFATFATDAAGDMDFLGFAPGDSNRGFFSLDLRSGRWQATGAARDTVVASRIRSLLREARTTPMRRLDPRVAPMTDLGNPLVLSYAAVQDRAGAVVGWMGFTYSRHLGWRSVGGAVMAELPLLPGSLLDSTMQAGLGSARSDSLIAMRVVDAAGAVLYESRPPFAGSPAGSFTSALGSGVRFEATLHPDLVARLRTGLRAGNSRIFYEYRDIDGRLVRAPLPLEALLPVVTFLFAVFAGVGLWRERSITRTRRDFVASVSHELRTPLAQIRMFTETLQLRRERDDDERAKWLGIIGREARRLGDMVENILLFSHVDADRAKVEKERTDLGELVEEVVEGYVPQAAQREMRIVADAPSRIFCLVDPRAMRQVVVNLLDNALKYGPRGQVVNIDLERVEDRVKLRVRDQGPGIPVADRRRVWRPFVRLGTKAVTGGSGIGLAVVRELVALHDGTVSVAEAEGGGALFEVDLPASDSLAGLTLRETGEFRAREVAARAAADRAAARPRDERAPTA
ncbi:MAG: HAMP domain-containing histidine kinase [Gemmatimonadetes bacterium]|nr:HAMP domain-containing histidine kinase [Gemmatimonadota bacterium]